MHVVVPVGLEPNNERMKIFRDNLFTMAPLKHGLFDNQEMSNKIEEERQKPYYRLLTD